LIEATAHRFTGRSERRWRQRIRSVFPFAVVAIIYGIVAGHQIELPGVYMDAVNPDYLAVRILNWNRHPFAPWIIPGTDLFDHFPVLVSLYHGMQQLYLALPVFWLLGTTVTSLRVAHALFALGILAAMYALLIRSKMDRWWAAAICAALVLDPGFVYSFRTQSYITVAPVAWLLLSVDSLRQRASTMPAKRTRWLGLSGLFFGLSIYGYFVYAFYVPALAIAVITWRAKDEPSDVGDAVRGLAYWGAGILCGCGFYVLGYGLLAKDQSGLHGLVSYVMQYQEGIGAFSAHQPLSDRMFSAWHFVESIFHNWWNTALMFGDYTPVPGAYLKTAILLGLPVLLWIAAETRRRSTPLLRLVLGLEVSFFAGALVFGNRLGGHHFASLLPLSYVALAFGLWTAADVRRTREPIPRNVFAGVIAFTLLSINIAGELRESDQLRATHGVGLYSDAINHLADDLLKSGQKDLVFVPDWGLFMPVAFLTGGHVALVTDAIYELARSALCQNRTVAVALINGDREARYAEWRNELGVAPDAISDYRQFDGKVVFQLATFRRKSTTPACAA
jgi:hypothetical protein